MGSVGSGGVLLVGPALGARKKGTVRGVRAGIVGQTSDEGVGVNVGRRCGR